MEKAAILFAALFGILRIGVIDRLGGPANCQQLQSLLRQP